MVGPVGTGKKEEAFEETRRGWYVGGGCRQWGRGYRAVQHLGTLHVKEVSTDVH